MSIAEGRVLELALEYLEKKKREIEAEISQIKSQLDYVGTKHRGRPRRSIAATDESFNAGQKRAMPEAQKKAISEKLKQKWAERKNAKTENTSSS